ncbi:MAG: UDP-N-acetylmuramoyl-tripeptide--D-alanyl-D-alanine ligase [Betaproteobacteria bacterium HGW-Betaproteobacteria-22]|nr:MAG: UDP-N-acetylmuramoyl-tripeptide--D-alanyl-D-alanine ligase [Betaproteobacteria bacterium HGW-Betaproteobacteria-22]
MMRASEAAIALDAGFVGEDVVFSNVGSDSRHVTAGQLFVALKGERFDGNAYATEAIRQGAVAVLLSDTSQKVTPRIEVQDTRLALGTLAKYWRGKFATPVVAITGSNGKTTTKEMLASILAVAAGDKARVHATIGNLNNDIGLPLTLLQLRAEHAYTVLEMGMNHLGEIDYLTHIARPDVAVINNAGIAHLGELGSRENIAKAKGEIFSGLAKGGVAVINADSEYADYWQSLNAHRKVVTFSLKKDADIYARYQAIDDGAMVDLHTPEGQVSFKLRVPGEHNVSNALAACGAAYALGIPNQDIADGLTEYAGVYGRLEHKPGLNGALIIDDTYNANPDSMKVAIEVLARMEAGKKILVLGDMGELGADAKAMHAEIGGYAKAAGLNTLYCLGELSAGVVTGFGSGARHFDTVEALAEQVVSALSKDTVVLVKGSRFMQMEHVVKLLQTKDKKTVHGEKQ